MEIRRITNDESEFVIDLFDKYRVFYEQESNYDLAKDFISKRLINNESIIFVAFRQDGNTRIPVGFTQLYTTFSSVQLSKNWILNDLYVERNYRKQGIGKGLINAAIEFAKKDGASFLELSTAINNITAQKLYEDIGFVRQQPSRTAFTYRTSLLKFKRLFNSKLKVK